MVLLAMLPDAAFHSTLLKALAVSRAHGLRFNVGEVKDGGRHVVGRLDRVGGKVGYGAVVVDVKVSDAMMIVVMGKEFTKFFRVIFDKEAYNYGELVNYLTPERERERVGWGARGASLLTDRDVIIGVSWWCRWRDLYTIKNRIFGRQVVISLLREVKVVAVTGIVNVI